MDQKKSIPVVWCTCPGAAGFDDPFYVPDNWCPCGEKRHHWHCGQCKGRMPGYDKLTEEALDSFWDVIVGACPQIGSGDLSPSIALALQQAAEAAVNEWIRGNVPPRQHSSKATSGPWFVDCSSPHSPLCIKPYPGRIVCDIDGADEEAVANANLIAAAPELRTDSQALYDAVLAYVKDVSPHDLPEDLIAAFDSLADTWEKADGRVRESIPQTQSSGTGTDAFTDAGEGRRSPPPSDQKGNEHDC